MPSLEMSTQAEKQYYLITNVSSYSYADKEIDLNAESWKLPYSIDDSDLTFDGKPLNLLYEENRWKAEHHVDSKSSRDYSFVSSGSSGGEKRGRTRKSRK
jgi:hypothetical protein